MLAVVALTPVLVFTDQWHATQVADLRDHPARLVGLVLLAGAIVAAMAALFRRRPQLLPLAIIAALPFRVPLHSAGDQANLLVPLYLVIAAGVILIFLGALLFPLLANVTTEDRPPPIEESRGDSGE